MANPLILFSTQTWLAWSINETYYSSVHWVWCSPFFSLSEGTPTTTHTLPVSAIPFEIYRNLKREVETPDSFSPWVEKNRVGLIRGISAKAAAKVIAHDAAAALTAAVRDAELHHFRPLIYIIPYAKVSKIVEVVPPGGGGANPFSAEYRIPALPRRCFNVQEIPL